MSKALLKICSYIIGNFRYKLYYNPKLSFLIRKHIREQIEMRIKVMNRECYDNGECVLCGCSCTALQMCERKCEGDCYPKMVNKRIWNKFNISNEIPVKFGQPILGINFDWVVYINYSGKKQLFKFDKKDKTFNTQDL